MVCTLNLQFVYQDLQSITVVILKKAATIFIIAIFFFIMPTPHIKFTISHSRCLHPHLAKVGGMYIRIGSDSDNNTFLVKNCSFQKNHASYTAGGMIAEFLNSVKHNIISVVETTFDENICMSKGYLGTGGLVVSFTFNSQLYIYVKLPQNNTFECQFCSFRNNIGHTGGGTSIFAAKDTNKSSLSTILFSKCNWTDNESAMGAAVFITPAIWDYTKEGYLPVPKFIECRFESNSAIQQLTPPMAEGIGVKVESVGYGALFASQMHVTFEDNTYFGSNRGSAIHLSGSVVR